MSVSSLHMLSGTAVRSDGGSRTGEEWGESGDPEDAKWHVGRLEGEGGGVASSIHSSLPQYQRHALLPKDANINHESCPFIWVPFLSAKVSSLLGAQHA